VGNAAIWKPAKVNIDYDIEFAERPRTREW
jgi:hypothetical protein